MNNIEVKTIEIEIYTIDGKVFINLIDLLKLMKGIYPDVPPPPPPPK